MGGRMGGDRVTTTNLEIKAVDEVNNILFVQGAVPGSVNGFIAIQGGGELKVNLQAAVKTEESQVEEVKTEEVKEVKTEEAKVEEVAAVETKTADEPVVVEDKSAAASA